METLYLTNKLREDFKKPFGTPILGKKTEIVKRIERIVKKRRIKKLICVGDYCSLHVPSGIKIFDGRMKRNKRVCLQEYSLSCKNPPASIYKSVWEVLREAIRNDENVFVDGEEDLLVIPCILLSERKYGIIYGLPNRGVSFIEVSPKIKSFFRIVLRKFKTDKFRTVVFGGTFDRLHKGHRYFILRAKYYARKALIGLCSDKMVRDKKADYKKVQSFIERRRNLDGYLRKIKLPHEIFKIENIYGSAIEKKDIEAILLTEETFKNGVKINKERKKRGFHDLNYIVLPYFLDLRGKKVSSSSIRS